MSTKHTPGPWGIFEWTGNPVMSLRTTAQGFGIEAGGHRLPLSDQEGPIEEAEANARLIAAAPELLAAAQKALAECCDLVETDAGRALEDAIAEATGEQQ